jgi:hypothetical protein
MKIIATEPRPPRWTDTSDVGHHTPHEVSAVGTIASQTLTVTAADAGWSILSASHPDRTSTPEHTGSTPPSTMDMKMALIREEIPGQSLDHGCAARDSNPEPAG